MIEGIKIGIASLKGRFAQEEPTDYERICKMHGFEQAYLLTLEQKATEAGVDPYDYQDSFTRENFAWPLILKHGRELRDIQIEIGAILLEWAAQNPQAASEIFEPEAPEAADNRFVDAGLTNGMTGS